MICFYFIILIFRQPCPWNITLDRLLESEIELVEKTKLDHSFVSIQRILFFIREQREQKKYVNNIKTKPIESFFSHRFVKHFLH